MILSNVLLTLTLVCAPTITKSYDGKWTEDDRATVATAAKRCTELFNGRSPCLKSLTKTGEQQYQAICGAPVVKK